MTRFNSVFSFGIASNVISTTTDNGSNFVKAFKVFGATADGDLSALPQLEFEAATDVDDPVDRVEVCDLATMLASEEDGVYELPKHWRCAAHTLNLVATADAERAFNNINYKKANRSAFGKAVSLWNKQSRSSQTSDIIRLRVGRLLVVPNATRWNSVYDAVVNLLGTYHHNKSGFHNACRELETRCFTTNDLNFLAEYKDVMALIAAGLDMLQGEEKAYMGLLLPALASILHNLRTKEQSNCLVYCKPLIECMIFGLEKRFNVFFSAKECFLASATHPNYRLSRWLDWLPGVCAEDVRQMVITHIANNLEIEETEENCDSMRSDYSLESGENHLLPELYASYSKKDASIKEMVSMFINGQPSRSSLIPDTFPNKSFHQLFIKYNTSIPSSAAVERMFSLGKDIMRPRRSKLTDKHFEMLVFLQGNKM